MESSEKLPLGWTKVKSKSHPGKVYFYNKETKTSVWKLNDIDKYTSKQKSSGLTMTTPKKSPEKSLSRLSTRSKSIGKRNLAEQRMKNLKMALELEKDEKTNGIQQVKKTKSKESIMPREIVPKTTKKVPLSPRKRAERKDPAVAVSQVEKMDVDMISSQELSSVPDDYVESMEWEEIDESEVVKEVLNVRLLKSNASSLVPRAETIESHVHKNIFFIVVDTNIFCSNLQFIDRIKGKNFKGIFFL